MKGSLVQVAQAGYLCLNKTKQNNKTQVLFQMQFNGLEKK